MEPFRASMLDCHHELFETLRLGELVERPYAAKFGTDGSRDTIC
jgi:hypothetical protein